MEFCKVNAIIHINSLEAVEEALRRLGTCQVAVSRVKGYCDYKNLYDPDWMAEQARVEVFVRREQAAAVADAICHAAYSGEDSDGIVAVVPVETLVRIKDSGPHPGETDRRGDAPN
jgi:nitrogen regulatory protein P-II 1